MRTDNVDGNPDIGRDAGQHHYHNVEPGITAHHDIAERKFRNLARPGIRTKRINLAQLLTIKHFQCIRANIDRKVLIMAGILCRRRVKACRYGIVVLYHNQKIS